jgi:PTH2 family peptidyl-tRNA hydrolase
VGEKEGDEDDFEDEDEDYKMVFLVRMDLKMGLGKIAAQVGHGTLKAYKQMEARIDKCETDEVSFFEWMEGGSKKIVLKVLDEKQLMETLKRAEEMKLNNCYIRDAGLTQV